MSGGNVAATEDKWHRARLIPTTGITGPPEQERRGVSVLLAVLAAVPEFGRVLTARMGAPTGKIETFTEVEFAQPDLKLRPDGLIRVQRGQRSWVALVEVKTMHNPLAAQQVESYLDVAREKGYDAIVTISNQISPEPGGHPLSLDRRKLRKVALHHLSWSEIRTEALIEKINHSITNPDHAWLLSEFIAYLEDERSGALDFDDMGPEWVTVREAAVTSTLRPADRTGAEVVARFAELVSYAGMRLSRQLGVDVHPVTARREQSEAVEHLQAQATLLASSGRMTGTLLVPNTVAPMSVAADLRAGRVMASVTISAPTTKVRPSARVNWLLRQLSEAPPDLIVEAVRARARSGGPSCRLDKIRTDPNSVIEDQRVDIRAFTLTLSRPAGAKRGKGRGSFVHSVLDVVDDFYALVVQYLKPWAPPPPKLKGLVTGDSPGEEDAIVVPTQDPSTHEVGEDDGSEPLSADVSLSDLFDVVPALPPGPPVRSEPDPSLDSIQNSQLASAKGCGQVRPSS